MTTPGFLLDRRSWLRQQELTNIEAHWQKEERAGLVSAMAGSVSPQQSAWEQVLLLLDDLTDHSSHNSNIAIETSSTSPEE